MRGWFAVGGARGVRGERDANPHHIKPVTLTRGADRFTADTLDYDNLSGVANLQGRVRGLLVPGIAQPGGTKR